MNKSIKFIVGKTEEQITPYWKDKINRKQKVIVFII